ncbi:3-hydroxyacyl-CoA dehydrogenase NAD-binding domain-containing protein [Castellaniella sp. GW247-6E4]|uniref:3-hydroxyacyl-CoA dehydrogenase n=1 Tax=Castellaniella sp. GW247-6E4 TaxID=3140380 RepID=UPI0033146AF3
METPVHPIVEAQALDYLLAARRQAGLLPDEWRASPREVRRVAVIGAGTMGTGIVIALLEAGMAVVLLDRDDGVVEQGRQRIVQHYERRVSAGKMSGELAATRQSAWVVTTDWASLADVDLVIEAVYEDLAVKQEVFRRIDASAGPDALLATNTSYLNIDDIAAATRRPRNVLGLHFFSPAHVMRLLEVVRAAQTSPVALATGMALGARLGKTAVLAGNAFGFIGNRIYNAYRRECEFMLEDGAWPEDVDRALTALGFAMGPFAVADMSGLDIAWRMRRAQAATRDPRERYVSILDHLCELGRLGRKTGAGYYAYVDGRAAPTTDDVVRGLIERSSTQRGMTRRALAPETIQRRALLAMVNEAGLLLAEGVALRPSDVDVVLTEGYGFPRALGGPVFWARHQAAERLAADLQALCEAAGHGFVRADLSVFSGN